MLGLKSLTGYTKLSRYRDLETGTFITRDPLGFVDGPNMYAYVVQNPWTKFDPEGLNEVDINKEKLKAGDIGLQTEGGKTDVLAKASQVAMSEKVGVRPSEVNGEKVPSRIGHGTIISKDPEYFFNEDGSLKDIKAEVIDLTIDGINKSTMNLEELKKNRFFRVAPAETAQNAVAKAEAELEIQNKEGKSSQQSIEFATDLIGAYVGGNGNLFFNSPDDEKSIASGIKKAEQISSERVKEMETGGKREMVCTEFIGYSYGSGVFSGHKGGFEMVLPQDIFIKAKQYQHTPDPLGGQ